MAEVIYTLCAATSLLCAWLLLRSYSVSRSRLLLWSGLCFMGLAMNNIMLVTDLIFLSNIDLSTLRLVPAVIGMMLLVYGLIWEDK